MENNLFGEKWPTVYLIYHLKTFAAEQIETPKMTYFPNTNEGKVLFSSGNGANLFAINQYGQVFQWQSDINYKFQFFEPLKQETFRGISVGKGLIAFTKTLVNPEKCLLIEKKAHIYNSNEPIKYQVKLYDDIGEYGLLPFYPMRYNVLLTNEPIQLNELLQLSQNSLKQNMEKVLNPNEKKLQIKELGTTQLVGLQVVVDAENTIAKSGEYYLYILLNEIIIQNIPIEMSISKGNNELQDELDELKQLEKEELQKQKQEEKQRKLDEKKLQQEQAEQQQENKIKETYRFSLEQRAEEKLKKFMEEQQQQKELEEKQKKERIELRIGGGYNLNKGSSNDELMQSEIPEIQEQKQIIQKQLQPKQQIKIEKQMPLIEEKKIDQKVIEEKKVQNVQKNIQMIKPSTASGVQKKQVQSQQPASSLSKPSVQQKPVVGKATKQVIPVQAKKNNFIKK